MIVQGICPSYLLESQQGVHDWGVDTFKLALYVPGTNLKPSTTTVYSAVGEVVGAGYVAGGVVLALTGGYPQLSASGRVIWDFADVVLNPAIFTARYAVIYNASKGNRAFAVLDFCQDYQAFASFGITWPVPTDNSAAVTLGA